MKLSIDLETRGTVDLRKTGAYRYFEDESTAIWCAAWAIGDEDPQLWVPGDPVPQRIIDHVEAGGEIRGWNVAFERLGWWNILTPKYGWPRPALEQFVCTMAEAAAMSLPLSLGQCASVLKLDQQKDDGGSRLMMLMARPRRPRKGEPKDRLYWYDDEDRKQRLFEYCRQDVRTEREIAKYLRRLSDDERRVYLLDQTINDRGVPVDLPLAKAAEKIAEQATEAANGELELLTGIKAVTAVAQLAEYTGLPDCRRETLEQALEGEDLDDTTRRILELRLNTAKTSVKKLPAMRNAAGRDGRVRGTLQYHGAATGRWSGRILQTQNIPRGEVEDPEQLIPLFMDGDLPGITKVAPPMVAISGLLRSMIRAEPGKVLMSGDYAQIEARVLAWLAGQDDLVRVFRQGGPVYERMAAAIFRVPVEEVTQEQRHVGKTVILAAGFGMGWAKFGETLVKFGVQADDALAQRAINAYRSQNDKIVELWYGNRDKGTEGLQGDILRAVKQPGSVQSAATGGRVKYTVRGSYLWCRLPSGRFLAYALPQAGWELAPWGEYVEAVTVCGVDSVTRKWERRSLYGGLATENVVQAIARDLLATAMTRLEANGYPIIMTVHDEVVAEVPGDFGSVEEFESIMAETPEWADGLPVKVEAWAGLRYRK